MEGKAIAFIIWCLLGSMFLFFALYAWFSKRSTPMGFWANAEVFEVTDVKKYNRAVSKLFFVFGIVLILLGLPLLAGQNSPWIIVSIVGTMVESIAAMAVYSLVIERKYRKSHMK